jgi:hypothetical protein
MVGNIGDQMTQEDTKEWWVSCKAFTCWMQTRGTRIIAAAPIAQKWVGKNFLRFLAYYDAERRQIR